MHFMIWKILYSIIISLLRKEINIHIYINIRKNDIEIYVYMKRFCYFNPLGRYIQSVTVLEIRCNSDSSTELAEEIKRSTSIPYERSRPTESRDSTLFEAVIFVQPQFLLAVSFCSIAPAAACFLCNDTIAIACF